MPKAELSIAKGLCEAGSQSEYSVWIQKCSSTISQQYLCMKILYVALKHEIIQIDGSGGGSVMLKRWGFSYSSIGEKYEPCTENNTLNCNSNLTSEIFILHLFF